MKKSKHSPDDTRLFRSAASGNRDAVATIVDRNTGLVIKTADYYARRNPLLDARDLQQCGFIGLLRAIEKFDIDRGFRFSTYATPWVKQPIQRYVVANHGRAMSAGKKDVEQYIHGSASKELIDLYELRCFSSVSLDAPSSHQSSSIVEVIASDDEGPDEEVERRLAAQQLGTLLVSVANDRDVWVFTEYHGLFGRRPRTMADIGYELGVTAQAVKNIVDDTMAKLRIAYGAEDA